MSESVRGCESNSCEYLIRNLFVLLLSSIASFILGFHCRRSDLIWPSVSSHDRTFQHMAPRRMAASNFETNAGKDNILALVGVFSVRLILSFSQFRDQRSFPEKVSGRGYLIESTQPLLLSCFH